MTLATPGAHRGVSDNPGFFCIGDMDECAAVRDLAASAVGLADDTIAFVDAVRRA